MDAPAGFSASTPDASDIHLTAMLLAGDDYYAWQPCNGRMFSFNHGVLDRFVVKPAAALTWAPEVAGSGA